LFSLVKEKTREAEAAEFAGLFTTIKDDKVEYVIVSH
jgi:hypothetical protein